MCRSDEEQLFRRAQAGDRAAFDRLRDLLAAPARRFIRRLIGSSDAEDDILQDALVALYLHRHRIDPVANLRPFFFRIIRNFCYGELRRRGRFKTVPLDEPDPAEDIPLLALIDPGPRPDERAHWTLVYASVQKAIQRLPELQRQTLILCCAEELTYAQAAYAMETDV